MLPKPKSSEVGHTVTAGQGIKDGSQAIKHWWGLNGSRPLRGETTLGTTCTACCCLSAWGILHSVQPCGVAGLPSKSYRFTGLRSQRTETEVAREAGK